MAFPVADGVELVTLPPPGLAINPANPQRHGQVAVYVAFSVFTAVASGFLAMRLYTNAFVTKRLGREDYLMVASYAVALTTQALAIWFFAAGAGGVHIWEMSVNTFNKWMLSGWIFTCIYSFCSSFTKLSVLLFCIRVERPRTGWYRTSVIAIMCFLVCYTLGIFFACVFACQPFRKAFDIRVREGKCVDQAILNIATSFWNLATDITVLLLAFHLVRWWRLSKLEKWGLFGFLVIVSLTIAVSVLRTLYLFQAFHSTDITWDLPTLVIWTFAKLDLTVICGCLPAVRDFVYHLCPRLRARHDEASSKRSGGRRGEPPALFPPRLRDQLSWPKGLLGCCPGWFSEKPSYNSTGALSTERSGKSLVSHDQTPMRSQCETDWSTTVAAVEEDPVERMTRSVHQQATRDYHSHLYQNWWDQA